MKPATLLLLTLMLSAGLMHAQPGNPDTKVKLSGIVVDALSGYGLQGLMILNKRTKTGTFGEHTGDFSIIVQKSDTIKFSVVGYTTLVFTLSDSAYKEEYHVKLKMEKLHFDLGQVEVFPIREFAEIKKDIDDLGVKYKYQVEGFSGLASPITFFYERFSRFEKQKRLAAELYNEEAKREILKELFRRYIRADIFYLSEKEFDDFLAFCDLPEEFIKAATQYELIMAIKERFEFYSRYRR
jgi:hypothetical protein